MRVNSWRLRSLVLLGILIGMAAACTGVRHVAVVADESFAATVFAVDDAAFKACADKTLTQAQCDAINPKVKAALSDVKGVTQALIDTPKDAQVPKTLPDLLSNLTKVQALLADVTPSPVKQDLSDKVTKALDKAIEVVSAFTGGVK